MGKNLTDQSEVGDNTEILENYVKFREANNKSKSTIKGDLTTLTQLLAFTKDKPLRDINESDLQGFIKSINKVSTVTQYGMRLINFYRWLFKAKKKERPENMVWFEFPSEELKAKNRDPDVKKYLITPKEYEKIIQYCKSDFKWSAFYETLYLSGGRPNEVNEMNIGDVIVEGGKVTVVLMDSKTIPRKVPLPDNPKFLIRWIQNHPFKDKPDAPLFHSNSGRTLYKRMHTSNINYHFVMVKKHTGIKSTLSPHCFRKTRATIMFSSRNPVFDDSEIAKFFGWKPHTVSERRQQYDLRDFDDLKAKIQGKVETVETYETIVAERDTLKDELSSLREQVAGLYKMMETNNVVWKDSP